MTIGLLSSGLLAELPAILDSFFTNTTSDFIGVVSWGWWGATKWWGENTSGNHTSLWIHWYSRQPKK